MLVKTPRITVFPAVEGRPYRAASQNCYPTSPTGVFGDTNPPVNPPPPSGVVPPTGTPIWLVPIGGDGYAGTYPPPAGYVCYYQQMIVYQPGSLDPATIYYVTCVQQ